MGIAIVSLFEHRDSAIVATALGTATASRDLRHLVPGYFASGESSRLIREGHREERLLELCSFLRPLRSQSRLSTLEKERKPAWRFCLSWFRTDQVGDAVQCVPNKRMDDLGL